MAGTSDVKLEIFLYCNRLQLGNDDILYSDGDRYRPALIAIDYLKTFLPSTKRVLVLGTGLGSIVRIIRGKGFDPHFTLIENDKEILKCAVEFLEEDCPSNIDPVCGDAMVFMQKNTANYDLIFIDIFKGRIVPDFVTTPAFLKNCFDSLAPGGHLAFNYIINDRHKWDSTLETFSEIFPHHKVINNGINRIFIT